MDNPNEGEGSDYNTDTYDSSAEDFFSVSSGDDCGDEFDDHDDDDDDATYAGGDYMSNGSEIQFHVLDAAVLPLQNYHNMNSSSNRSLEGAYSVEDIGSQTLPKSTGNAPHFEDSHTPTECGELVPSPIADNENDCDDNVCDTTLVEESVVENITTKQAQFSNRTEHSVEQESPSREGLSCLEEAESFLSINFETHKNTRFSDSEHHDLGGICNIHVQQAPKNSFLDNDHCVGLNKTNDLDGIKSTSLFSVIQSEPREKRAAIEHLQRYLAFYTGRQVNIIV